MNMNAFRLASLPASILVLSLLGAAAAHAADESVLVRASNGVVVTATDVLADAERIPPEVRAHVFQDAGRVAQQASNLAVMRSLAAQARAEGLAEDPMIAAAVRQAADAVLGNALLARAVAAVEVDRSAAERLALADYRSNPQRFRTEEEVQARHILLRGEGAVERAKALREQLLQPGADFAAFAEKHSEDPGSAVRGGDLGFFARGRMVGAFEEAAFALEPGGLSEVIETEFGAHIIKVEARRAPGVRPFEDVRESLVAEIVKSLQAEARAALVAPITASVVPDIDALQAFSASQTGAR
ncbi:MAG: peptidylprolyl isomerase [Thauera sp.]|jgi:peptidyl-prolyl cis-trans isomerase C|nr:peptidylprolyl isomerase [Thauera sp.]